ncbi:MAG: hypothetical protein Q7T44_13125 [Parvibaculum sp.]|nr:hypothetical protein [Parvibaculum sp.]
MRKIILVLLALIFPATAFAAEPCAPRKAVAPALARLEAAMATNRFIAYNPTELKVIDGNITVASADSIRADLKALRPHFDALITYSARDGNEHVADIAAELGFKALIIGLWTPADMDEIRNAIRMAKAHPKLVTGISLGNEIVLANRGKWKNMGAYVALMRARLPDVPLTVTEPFAQFQLSDAEEVLPSLDFMLVNIHPIFEKWFATAPAQNWANFVVKVSDNLASDFCGPILVKETGTPSGPAERGFTPEMQASFWRELEKQMPPTRARAFAYFAAFDAPWRVSDFDPMGDGHNPEEAHWGFMTDKREAKPALMGLPKRP